MLMVSKTDRKICGTCEYWSGERMPIFDKNGSPKISITDSVGLCNNISSKFIDKERKKDLNCKAYSKWTEIL